MGGEKGKQINRKKKKRLLRKWEDRENLGCFPHNCLDLWFLALSDLFLYSWIPVVGDTYLICLASTYIYFCLHNILLFFRGTILPFITVLLWLSVKVSPLAPVTSILLIKMEKISPFLSTLLMLLISSPFLFLIILLLQIPSFSLALSILLSHSGNPWKQTVK